MDNHIPESDSRLLKAVRWLFAAVMAVILGLLYNEALFMLAALVAAVGGSWMVKSTFIELGKFDKITKLAREAVYSAKDARKIHQAMLEK